VAIDNRLMSFEHILWIFIILNKIYCYFSTLRMNPNFNEMKLTKIITTLTMVFYIGAIGLTAQTTKNTLSEEDLKGLTKASDEDLSNKEIILDGETIPIYDIERNRIRGMEIMQVMMSSDYTPDFYIDQNGEIKVVLLRKATDEEKEIMGNMQSQMQGENELIGKDAIPFTATDINGKEYTLSDLKGKIIVMNFWFIECKPCLIEIPELNELVEKYENENVVFLGFAKNDTSKLVSFLENKKFLYNIIPNSTKVIDDYNVFSYPTHIIIDQDAKVSFLSSGLGPTTIHDIENNIQHLLEK